jgi:hypothetical protein
MEHYPAAPAWGTLSSDGNPAKRFSEFPYKDVPAMAMPWSTQPYSVPYIPDIKYPPMPAMPNINITLPAGDGGSKYAPAETGKFGSLPGGSTGGSGGPASPTAQDFQGINYMPNSQGMPQGMTQSLPLGMSGMGGMPGMPAMPGMPGMPGMTQGLPQGLPLAYFQRPSSPDSYSGPTPKNEANPERNGKDIDFKRKKRRKSRSVSDKNGSSSSSVSEKIPKKKRKNKKEKSMSSQS